MRDYRKERKVAQLASFEYLYGKKEVKPVVPDNRYKYGRMGYNAGTDDD